MEKEPIEKKDFTFQEENKQEEANDSPNEENAENGEGKEKRKFLYFDKDTKKLHVGKFKVSRKILIICIIILIIIVMSIISSINKNKLKSAQTEAQIVTVEKRNISKTVTGSSVIEAKDSYSVTAMVSGEIISDTFNEGDTVEKDDVLYVIDSETAQKSVDSAKNALTKAQQTYRDAVKSKSLTAKTNDKSVESAQNAVKKAERTYNDAIKAKANNASTQDANVKNAQNSLEKAQNTYDDALRDYEDLNILSDIDGTVSEVYIKEGDSITAGTKIAEIYNDDYLKISVPFNEDDANRISEGEAAELTIVGTGNTVWGVVTGVSGATIANDKHSLVKYVTIELTNPGALTQNDKATASVGDIKCNDYAQFEYSESRTISSKASGTVYSVDIASNDRVYSGETVVYLTSDTLDSTLKNAQISLNDAQLSLDKAVIASDDYTQDSSILSAKIALDDAYASLEKTVLSSDSYTQDSNVITAQLSLDDARISLEKAEKTLEDYTIKAPISGTVVTKNSKTGDNLNSGSSSSLASASSSSTSSNAMAVIYDMSSLKFSLSVDETEIEGIKTGQTVKVTADAVEGKEFKGVVEKVGVDGTSSNGVTTYPVTVAITEVGDLLPGMNIDAEIVVEEVSNVISVPVSCVNRGNIVYVQGDKTDEADKAPEGYKSVEVITGINDEDYIEIKSGLSEGDMVYTEPRQSSGDEMYPMMMEGDMGGGPGGGMGGGTNGSGGGAPGGGASGGGPM